jgi:hypothetical protein
MNQFFDTIINALDFLIVGIVLVSGFFQRMYLKGFRLSKDGSYDQALKTLLVSAIFSTIYILLIKNPGQSSNWAKYFLSYVFATSLYELLITPFMRWIKKKTGDDADSPIAPSSSNNLKP